MDQTMKKELQDVFEATIEKTLKEDMPAVVKETVQKEMSETLKSEVEAALKAAGLDQALSKMPALNGSVKNTDPRETAVKFFKAVFNKDREAIKELGSEYKTMTEGSDSAGGFLVPEEVSTMIDRVADDFGLIRTLARRVPMSKDIMNMTILGTKPTFKWVGETQAGTPSQPSLRRVKLEARTAMGLTPMSNDLVDDANIDVIDMVVELIAEQIGGGEDEQAFSGVGTPFTGVLNSEEVSISFAATATAITDVTLKDLSDATANIKSTVLGGSVWVFHRLVYNQIKNIKEDGKTVVAFTSVPDTFPAKSGPGGLTPVAMLWGYPVYLSDYMPSAPAAGEAYGVFGNFSKFYFGDRKQLAVATSSEATIDGISMFETNSTAVRVIERVALTVGVGEAFSVLKLVSL